MGWWGLIVKSLCFHPYYDMHVSQFFSPNKWNMKSCYRVMKNLCSCGGLETKAAISHFLLSLSYHTSSTIIERKLSEKPSLVFPPCSFCKIKRAPQRATVQPHVSGIWYSNCWWENPGFSFRGRTTYLGRTTWTLLGTIMLIQLFTVLVLMWGMMSDSGVELSIGRAISMLMLSPW